MRKVNESLIINENIVVTVLGVEGEKVKLGIQAPKEIPILRHELHEAIEQQSQIEEAIAQKDDLDQVAFDNLRKLLLDHVEDEPEETDQEKVDPNPKED
jgi:carbon storage regulator